MNNDKKPGSLEELVASARTGSLSRRGFIAAVTAAGATAGGAGILFAATRPGSPKPAAPASRVTRQEQTNIDLHDQHLSRQAGKPGTPPAQPGAGPAAFRVGGPQDQHLQAVMADYHDDAVVEDVMHDQPIAGRELIYARKRADLMSIADPKIVINNRFAYGDQVVAEWQVSGAHVGDYLGFAASGNNFTIHGITVVTRKDGRIIKESLYYDVEELTRQLSAPKKAPAQEA